MFYLNQGATSIEGEVCQHMSPVWVQSAGGIVESQVVLVEPDGVQLLNFDDHVGCSANHMCIHCKCDQSLELMMTKITLCLGQKQITNQPGVQRW